MEDVLRKTIAEAVSNYSIDVKEIEISHPESSFGDFSSNVALKLAKILGKDPKELAQDIAQAIKAKLTHELASIDIAGPGFINFKLSDSCLFDELNRQQSTRLKGQTIVVEFSDPNPFKIVHAGHLYTSIVGDSIARLLEQGGAKVYRVNYGGDVGLHVGKTMWAMINNLGGEEPQKLASIGEDQRAEWMSQAYVVGNEAYELNPKARQEIIELNKKVYAIQAGGDHDSPLAKIYWTTRQWSYEAFDKFYAQLAVHFDKFYPESEAAPIGIKIVNAQINKGVFESSDGAIVFKGEKYGLHTRVFINSQGLPTYEAKELGLVELKKRDYHYDRSIIITGNEQAQYMSVVLKALEQFAPELAHKTTHITHGMVRLTGGQKMSSRLGNVITAEDVLESAVQAATEISDQVSDNVVMAAIKYSMLKQGIGSDIIYEPKESVSVIGNSGPYLQYAHARARSILAKTHAIEAIEVAGITKDERSLLVTLSRYVYIIELASRELSPHILCTYLYELAQEFNRFYEANRVLDDAREAFRIYLIRIYAERLHSGLMLLGIEAPEKL